jgi:hypothetical protein
MEPIIMPLPRAAGTQEFPLYIRESFAAAVAVATSERESKVIAGRRAELKTPVVMSPAPRVTAGPALPLTDVTPPTGVRSSFQLDRVVAGDAASTKLRVTSVRIARSPFCAVNDSIAAWLAITKVSLMAIAGRMDSRSLLPHSPVALL